VIERAPHDGHAAGADHLEQVVAAELDLLLPLEIQQARSGIMDPDARVLAMLGARAKTAAPAPEISAIVSG
jgi:hypothetical protein